MIDNDVTKNGWTAIAVDAAKIFDGKPYIYEPTPLSVEDIKFPSDDPVVLRTQEYAKAKLPLQTYLHSMRVYYFGG